MTQKLDAGIIASRQISRQVKDVFDSLTIHFILYRTGQRPEAFGLSVQDILNHPAAQTGIQMLGRAKDEETSFLGLAVAQKRQFLGLAIRDEYLGLCCLNIDHYESRNDIRCQLYHLAWQCIAFVRNCEKNKLNAEIFSEILVPERLPQEICQTNMCADVFSIAMEAQEGDMNALHNLALTRSQQVLRAVPGHHPEYYPFPIAAESTAAALQRMENKIVSKKRRLAKAIKIVDDIGIVFGENALAHWLSFSEPAQAMAWRGAGEDEILSAAINTSDDTYVRSIGYLVSELTEIKPASILSIRQSYSAFADDSSNKALHIRIATHVFRSALSESLATGAALAFAEQANRQNYELSEGKHIGWCACALQKAGEAFERTIERSGSRMAQAVAIKEFETTMAQIVWDDLKELSDLAIQASHQGAPQTLRALLELCDGERRFAVIESSVFRTAAGALYGSEKLSSGGLKSRFSAQGMPMARRNEDIRENPIKSSTLRTV